jgi:hypothetical protein
MRRWYRTDRRLWGVLALAFASGVLVAEYLIDGQRWKWPIKALLLDTTRSADYWGYVLPRLIAQLIGKLVAGVAAAWIVHALLLRCGIRFPGRIDPAQADYDDRPAPMHPTPRLP